MHYHITVTSLSQTIPMALNQDYMGLLFNISTFYNKKVCALISKLSHINVGKKPHTKMIPDQ